MYILSHRITYEISYSGDPGVGVVRVLKRFRKSEEMLQSLSFNN